MRTSALLAATLSVAASPAPAEPLVLSGATIINSTGGSPVDRGVIVMDGGRIIAVGPASSTPVPKGAKIIDVRGKYVIPGLMNANVHLFPSMDIDSLIRFDGRYADVAVESAQVALKSGLTTVFDTWGPYPDLKEARDRINAGKAVGARIFFAGNIIGWDGPASLDFRDFHGLLRGNVMDDIDARWTQGVGRPLLWETSEDVGQKVSEYARKDEDFLKFGANGHLEQGFLNFSQGAQNAIVKVGHDAGKTVQAHVQSLEGIRSAMSAGVDILTHCDSTPKKTIPPVIIKEMLERKVYCSILPSPRPAQKESGNDFRSNSMINVKNMADAGVPLMLSTDGGASRIKIGESPEDAANNTADLKQGHFAALRALEEVGVAPEKILQMATINIARGYKVDKDFGSLEIGKSADMVVLDKNPLAAAANYQSINMVIKAGAIVDRDKLPVAPLYTSQISAPQTVDNAPFMRPEQ